MSSSTLDVVDLPRNQLQLLLAITECHKQLRALTEILSELSIEYRILTPCTIVTQHTDMDVYSGMNMCPEPVYARPPPYPSC